MVGRRRWIAVTGGWQDLTVRFRGEKLLGLLGRRGSRRLGVVLVLGNLRLRAARALVSVFAPSHCAVLRTGAAGRWCYQSGLSAPCQALGAKR